MKIFLPVNSILFYLVLLQYSIVQAFFSPLTRCYFPSITECRARADGKEEVQLEKVYNIGDLTPQNSYEVQILSAFNNYEGERIKNYFFPKNASTIELNRAMTDFYDSLPSNEFKVKSEKNHTKNCNFECDMYFRSTASIPSIDIFLSSSTEKVWRLNKVEYVEFPIQRNWIFMEISQGPQFLAQKLWQLERSTRLLSIHNESFSPSAIIVLLNGRREDAERAVNNMKLPDNFLISKLPVYVGWAPTRNIQRAFSEQSERIENQSKQIEYQSTKIEGLALASESQSKQIDNQSKKIEGLALASESQSKRIENQSERIENQSKLIDNQSKKLDSLILLVAVFAFSSQPDLRKMITLLIDVFKSF